ncbi:10806_t:CDS:2, partial [Racocetra persica]
HSKAMSEITIFCLVLGDAVSRSFPVDIDKSTISIGHLKELIKKKKDPYYNNISADEFELWSVDIPINLENIDTKINKEKISEYKGVRLLPNAVVETVFPENNKNSIRILVQPPATTGIAVQSKGLSRLGGLGGTNMKRKEDGLGYEGLDLTHIDNICQRKQTINRLIDDLLKKRIILVRSPPMAGKTSLAQLLEHNILQSDEGKNGLRCVFRISLMWMVKRGMEWTFAEGFKTLMNMEWGEFIQLCRHTDIDVVLIVDEVQLIYKPQNESEPRNGGGIFWDTFKEVKQYLTNLCIVAFASYGHYGAYTSYGDHSVMDISPPSILRKDDTWGFSDVRFTDEEFDDYVYRFCEMRLHMLKKGDIPFLHNYVREITAYHPGLIAFTMDEIYKRFVKRTSELEFGDIFAFLKSYEFYSHLKCIRATPQVTDMSDEEKKIVDKVLFKKSLKIQTNRIPYNSRIIKTNVLVDIGKTVDHSTLNFPAPLLMVTYLQDRFGHVTRSISPPSILRKDDTWGFSDVRFTDEEFDDYVYRFCEMRLHMLKKGDIPFLHNYVREITAYHPGLIAFTMDEIYKRFVKRTSELEFGDIFAFLKSYEFYSHLKCIRATPQVTDMSDEEKKIVDKVLFKKSLKIQTNRIPYNSRIIKTNVLVDIGKTVDHSTLNFPAPLLMVTYLQDRFGHVTRSISPPKTFEDFIKSVFAIMNPKILQNSKGRSKDGRLFERVWQMEFYRASLQVLPDDIYPSVDVGKVFRSKGYVDFYINDNRNWAIELLRDGEKLDQHKERFQKAGIYVPILKHTKRWAIIDIRNHKMNAPALEKREQNEIYVLCSENFELVQLVYPNGTKEDIRLLGEENLLGYDISEFLDDSMEID